VFYCSTFEGKKGRAGKGKKGEEEKGGEGTKR